MDSDSSTLQHESTIPNNLPSLNDRKDGDTDAHIETSLEKAEVLGDSLTKGIKNLVENAQTQTTKNCVEPLLESWGGKWCSRDRAGQLIVESHTEIILGRK